MRFRVPIATGPRDSATLRQRSTTAKGCGFSRSQRGRLCQSARSVFDLPLWPPKRIVPCRLSGVQKTPPLPFSQDWQGFDNSRWPAIIHPLLTLLASCSQQELARQNRYLKAENQVLRSKLPGRITLSNQDRRILVRHGKKLGPRIRDLISIVIHLGSRQIWVSPCTASPSGDWTAQQARNFSMHLQDQEGLECKILCRDNDSKYTEAFDGVFKSEGCQIKRTTPMSPNLQRILSESSRRSSMKYSTDSVLSRINTSTIFFRTRGGLVQSSAWTFCP